MISALSLLNFTPSILLSTPFTFQPSTLIVFPHGGGNLSPIPVPPMSNHLRPDREFEGSPIDMLASLTGARWRNIQNARKTTQERLDLFRTNLADLDNSDTSIVVFGSLARDEATLASDVDWTFLVDGKADPSHHDMALEVETRLNRLTARAPGREGTFGTTAFSHQILHFIGGGEDSNANITRRILLLLESRPLGNAEAWESVRRNLLSRYLREDRGLWQATNIRRVPLFLLNDITRYWRTMVVDFA